MKKLLFALFYISSIQCYSQIELSEITVYKDTIISSKVKIVDFGKYKGFVFPKKYGLVRFSHPKEKRECFDIDTILVRKIEEELTRQYYSAQKYFMEQRYNEIYEYERKYPGSYILKDLKKEEKQYWKSFEKNKDNMEKYLEDSDRQYIGYISNKGEKIIQIQITPRHYNYDDNFMKKGFSPIWLTQEGSDIEIIHYHLFTNKITINEDY